MGFFLSTASRAGGAGWTRRPLVASGLLLVGLVGCGSDGSPVGESTGTASSVGPAPTNPEGTEPTSSESTAAPVTTDVQSTTSLRPTSTSEPESVADPPGQEPSLSVNPSSASVGETVSVEVRCRSADLWAEAGFEVDSMPAGPLYEIPRSGDDLSGLTTFVGEITIPYWLPPGTQQLFGGCAFDEDRPDGNPPPVSLEVVADGEGPWDDWRPLAGPRVESLDGEPFEPGQPEEVPIADGTLLTVSATCSPSIEQDGARFVVWARLAAGTPDRSDGFFAVEFPVLESGYTDSGENVEISAEIVVRAADFPDPVEFEDLPILSALCESTATAFEADAEPPFEEADVILAPDFSS